MFKDLGNGYINIADNAFGYNYRCYLPPVGYGLNAANGLLQETDILLSSEIPIEQVWERPALPADFRTRRKKEKDIQKIDPYYVDQYLEEIRKREWKRRLCGVWFWNYNPILKSSELIYITGVHYLYITYWKFQGKLMDFRMADRDFFYVVAYCMEDEKCLGVNEITKRKNGKTARAGCWSFERVSRMNNHHAGLQSKSDDDAEDAFFKAIINPWQKLPDFFRPRYDLMKGEEPNELRFFATARRGSKVEEEDESIEEPLESFFDYKVATESAYDGPELHTYVSDEAGKTKKPVSIKERQNVTRFCTEIDFELKGKHYYTTTVEPEKNEEENVEFQELTANSNPLERDENGFTGTGLYTIFLPAQKGMYINKEYAKYGFVDEEMNLRTIANKIASLQEKNDTRGISSFKRKNPRNLKEAFSADGENALYNPELLNNQLDAIQWTNKFTEFGNLEWENGDRLFIEKKMSDGKTEIIPNKLKWVASATGKFEKIKDWFPKEENSVYYRNGQFSPNNDDSINMGCDPFKYDKTKDKRRSNCAAFAYQLPDAIYPDITYEDSFTMRYSYREESTRLANEDVLKMAWWCGCRVLFERNVNHWKDYFIDNNCADFLVWIDGEVEPGIITSTGSSGVQAICDYTESYINQHIEKVFFKTLLRKETGWLGFKVEDTEKFDEPMAAGVTLIRVRGMKRKLKSKPIQKNIQDYFPKANGWTYRRSI